MSSKCWLYFELLPRSSFTPKGSPRLSLSVGASEVGWEVSKPGREVWLHEARRETWAEAHEEKVSKLEPKELEPKMGSSSFELQVFGDFFVSQPKCYSNCLCWKLCVCLGQRNMWSAATIQNSLSSNKLLHLSSESENRNKAKICRKHKQGKLVSP